MLPSLKEYQSWWINASIPAFWLKNLASGAYHFGLYAEPVVSVPSVAYACIAVSYATIATIWFWYVTGTVVSRARSTATQPAH